MISPKNRFDSPFLCAILGAHSQGRVKVPTGGERVNVSPRAFEAKVRVIFPVFFLKVSRFGVNPKPTVIVWMKENKKAAQVLRKTCVVLFIHSP